MRSAPGESTWRAIQASGNDSRKGAVHESVRHTHGLTVDGLGAVQILVADADVEHASSLLEAAESGQFRLADDAGA